MKRYCSHRSPRIGPVVSFEAGEIHFFFFFFLAEATRISREIAIEDMMADAIEDAG